MVPGLIKNHAPFRSGVSMLSPVPHHYGEGFGIQRGGEKLNLAGLFGQT